MQMETKKRTWKFTTDEKTISVYQRLLHFYKEFKRSFGEPNFTWLAYKTGMRKWKVKAYLRWTRKVLDIWEIWALSFYLSNYDLWVKSRMKLKKENKIINKENVEKVENVKKDDNKDDIYRDVFIWCVYLIWMLIITFVAVFWLVKLVMRWFTL